MEVQQFQRSHATRPLGRNTFCIAQEALQFTCAWLKPHQCHVHRFSDLRLMRFQRTSRRKVQGVQRRRAHQEDIQSFGWTPLEDLSGDCNGHWAFYRRLKADLKGTEGHRSTVSHFGHAQGIDLALLLARNSSCKAGSMGCAIADQSGMIIAGRSGGSVTPFKLLKLFPHFQAM